MPDQPRLSGIVLSPSAEVALRWGGALKTRLRRAPLAAFLRTHGQTIHSGVGAVIVPNLVSATTYMVEPIMPHGQGQWRVLCNPRYFTALGGRVANVSYAVAELIGESSLWRVVALRSIATLLTPTIGPDMAATTAAASAANFDRRLAHGHQDTELMRRAAHAVHSCSATALHETRVHITDALARLEREVAPCLKAADRYLIRPLRRNR